MSVTLKDVAAKAGVSPVVVSRVLHNRAQAIRVSEATADRVRAAAEELGYRLNVWARNFRAQQTMMIGVLHGIGFERPRLDRGPRYFAALMDGILDGAFEHGYSVTLCPKLFGSSPEDALSDGRFDGLVWYSTLPSDANRRMLMECRVPLVLIHAQAEDFDNRFPTVICDNKQGIRLAVDHLLELGHRKIAFAWEGLSINTEARLRRNSYLQIMEELGMEPNVVDVHEDRSGIPSYFENGPLDHTAIIAYNDDMAADFIRQARLHDVRVPEELSIIGFDSTDFCSALNPELTSIYQPLALMGRLAIDVLMDVVRGCRPEKLELVIPCGLDVRGSTLSIGEQVNK